MTFYVIGNGFDLHYGLKTTYSNFKVFLLENGYWELVSKVDQLFFERGNFSPEDIDTWSKFEDMLQVFNYLDADEIYDEAMDDAETDDDRAGYWDSPSWNVGYYNEYIQVLKQQFDSWIRGFNTHIVPDQYFRPQKGDFVLTFNYTTTIEDSFHPVNYDIAHIHGTVGQNLVLGHNDNQKPDTFVIIEDEDSNYRDTTTKKAVNDVLELAAVQYFKNSERILSEYAGVFSSIPLYDKVVIMGLSCGPQDSMYVREILRYAKSIDFYYYDIESRRNFESYAAEHHADVNYIGW